MDHRKRRTLWLGLFCVLLAGCDSGTPVAPSPCVARWAHPRVQQR